MKYIHFIIISILSSGFGSFLYKYAVNYGHPLVVASISLATYLCLMPIAFLILRPEVNISPQLIFFTSISSIFLCIGTLCFSFALKSGGQVGASSILVAFSPFITLTLSIIFFGEQLTPIKITGLIFAALSFVLIGLR